LVFVDPIRLWAYWEQRSGRMETEDQDIRLGDMGGIAAMVGQIGKAISTLRKELRFCPKFILSGL